MLALSKRVSLDEASSKATKPKPRDSKILVTPWEAEDPDHYASSKFIDFLDSKMRNVEHPNKNNIAFHESLSPIPDIESYTQMLAEPIQSEQTLIENERKSFSRRRMVEEAFSKGKDSSMATTVNFNKKRIGRDDVNVQNLTMPSKIYVNVKDNINSNFQGREGSQQVKESFDKGMVSSNRSYKENGNINSVKRPATVLAGTIGSNESIDQDNRLEYDKVIEDELKIPNGSGPVTQKSRTISRLGNRNLYRRNFCGEGISLEGENNKSLFAFWNKERKNSRSHLKSGDQGRPSLEILDKTTEGTGLKSRIREVVERQAFSGKFLLTNTPTRTPKSITNQSITKTKDNRSPTKMRKLKARNEPNIRLRTSEKDLTEAGTSNTEVSLPALEETPTHHHKTLSNVGCKDLSQITLPTSNATSPLNQTSTIGVIRRPSTTKALSESRKALEGGFGQYLETVMETEGMKSDIVNSIKLTNKIWRRHKNKYNDKEQVPVVSSAKRAEEEKPEVVKKIERKLKKRNYDRDVKNSKGTPIEASLKASRNERKVGLEKRQGLSLNISEMNNSKPWHRLYPIETTKSFYMNRTLRREYLGENGMKSTLNQTQSKVNERPMSRLRNTVKSDGETKISFAQTQINFSTILQRRDSEGTKSVRKARAKKELY